MDTDVVIIGAGHNGLVAAFYLAQSGLKVHVFERRPFVGGAAITEELWPGMFFSTCAHYLQFVPPKLYRDLRLTERGFDVIPRPFRLHLRPDGSYWGPEDQKSPKNAAANLTAAERTAMARWEAFRQTVFTTLAPYRLRTPPTAAEFWAAIGGTPAEDVFKAMMTHRLHALQDQYLPTDSLRHWFLDEGAAVGRNPLALNLAYFSVGAAYPPLEPGGKPEIPQIGSVRGGMGQLTRYLREAAEEAGATIHVNQGIDSVLVAKGRAQGVRLSNGETVTARVVVSNLDPKRTFLRLLEPGVLDPGFRARIAKLDAGISSYKFLAVINELPEWKQWDGDPAEPSTGCVRMGVTRAELHAAYDDHEAGIPARRPLINFTVPSSVDPSLAKPGYHTASVWIFPAASQLKAGNWDDAQHDVAERLIDQITEYAPNFRRSIETYKLRTPLDIERENGITGGSIWHLHHDGDMLLWNRPLAELSQYRAPLQGLYLCGASQHTGGEVSGIPGHNAAHEILKDLGARD